MKFTSTLAALALLSTSVLAHPSSEQALTASPSNQQQTTGPGQQQQGTGATAGEGVKEKAEGQAAPERGPSPDYDRLTSKLSTKRNENFKLEPTCNPMILRCISAVDVYCVQNTGEYRGPKRCRDTYKCNCKEIGMED